MLRNRQHTTLTDEQLLDTFRRTADNQWLGHLLQRYTALLLGVAMKYLKSRPEAEDAVQQVFVKVLTHLPAGDIHNFKGWLYILMRNHCLQLLRDKTWLYDDTALTERPESETDPEETATREHTLQQMSEAIELLGKEQQQTIRLFYLDKNTYEQIIEKTGFTFMQVKSHIQNGKRNLRIILLKKDPSLRP